MSAIDATIVGAFLVYVIVNGLRERGRASGGLEQYFLAGRSLSGWQAGISMAATQFAADTPLLVTGLVAMGGIFALWRLWIYALAFLVLAFLLAACWRRAGVLTDAEFAELRYPGRGAAVLRLFKALYFGTLFNCVVLAIVLLATTRIAEPFLLWNEWLPPALFGGFEALVAPVAGALTATPPDAPLFTARAASNLLSLLAVALVTLAYSTLGGLRSVVKTDVVQFAIMMVASLAYAVVVVQAAGGLGPMAARLHAAFAQATGPVPMSASQLLAFTPSAAYDVGALLIAVFVLQWLIQVNADGTGYLAQRAMACRDDREASRAAVVFTFAQIVLRSLIWLPIALGLLLVFPPEGAFGVAGESGYVAAREASYVRGIAELLPVGLKGLMLTAMIAALASTIDTHLNWGAAYWTNDIYARFVARWLGRRPTTRGLVWVARVSNVLLLALALAVMTQLGSIKAAWEASLLLGAGVGVVLLLRWLWWRVSAAGELAAIVASSLLVPVALAWLPERLALARLLVVAVGATAAAVAVSLWVRPLRPLQLVEFYLKVHPPGWWGPVAEAAGEDPRGARIALRRGVTATLLCAVSVFGLLVGIGSWMLEATPPAWFAHRGGWIAANLVLAVGVMPLWLRRAAPAR
jgi:SSS family solute:Na+ symporter